MWNAALPELFRCAHLLGVQGIELWAQQFESRGYCEEECLQLMDQYPVKTFVHSKTWDLNFASMNRCMREASIGEIKASIDLAAKLHATEITVHPPRESLCGNLPFYRELAYQGLTEILSYARRRNVEVSLEVMEKIPKEMMTTLQQVQELTRDLYPDFSYTVDVAHCDDAAEVRDFLQELPRISKLHISNRRGSTYHTVLSDGDFSFPELLPSLQDSGLPMVVEGLDTSKEYTMLYDNMTYIQSLKESMK
jgi:sugar phosphate isomerase/epimerase